MVYSYCTETTYIYIYIQHCYIVHISTYIDNSNKLKKQRRKSWMNFIENLQGIFPKG